jgi:hypothetical protein
MKNSLQQPQRQSYRDFNPFFDTLQSWRGLPIAVIWLLNSTNSIYICFTGFVWLCIHCCLSEISEFYFYLDNENEEFIINEGILIKQNNYSAE